MRTGSANSSASGLRTWAHDTLDDIALMDAATAKVADLDQRIAQAKRADGSSPSHRPSRVHATQVAEARAGLAQVEAERRVATAALGFLREQPRGDGAEFRSWVATTNPFDDRTTDGVELLTFHAAKGREWHSVYVAGAETSLMPHKSATTAAEREEEARLLYVATTRATDMLVYTHAERRAGYARKLTPFLESLDVTGPEPVAPPPALRRERPADDALLGRLTEWRATTAKRARVVPTQILSDRDLSKIAATRPSTAEEIDTATSVGVLTARRLAPQVLPLIDEPALESTD